MSAAKRKRQLVSDSESDSDDFATPVAKPSSTPAAKKEKGEKKVQMSVADFFAPRQKKKKDAEKSSQAASSPPKKKKAKVIQLDEENGLDDRQAPAVVAASASASSSAAAPVTSERVGLPSGSAMCLSGLKFVVTGNFPIARGAVNDLITKYGGTLTMDVSRATSFLVAGASPGKKKVKKAEEILKLARDSLEDEDPKKRGKYKTELKQISMQELFSLIRTREPPKEPTTPKKKKAKPEVKFNSNAGLYKSSSSSSSSISSSSSSSSSSAYPQVTGGPKKREPMDPTTMLWVDKYAPTKFEHIVGNQTNVQRMKEFLERFDANVKQESAGRAVKGFHRALLLSGSPGIGKTTSAVLISKLCGFDPVEFNASDARSKKSLESICGELTSTHTIGEYFGQRANANVVRRKKVMVMDEVDGMSGNADRGGMQALIKLIKSTKIPIICICNDASSIKIRSLKNYTTNLSFRKPTMEQVRPRVMEICRAENVDLEQTAFTKLHQSAQGDLRQILNFLQLHKNARKLTFDDVAEEVSISQKDFTRDVFNASRDFFAPVPNSQHWIAQRQDSFFVDMDLMPLFVQNNYLRCTPSFAQGSSREMAMAEIMHKTSLAADDIEMGDVGNAKMRGFMDWSLLPSLSILSCISPGAIMSGGATSAPNFPEWLGNFSSRNKSYRQLNELKRVMSIDAGCNARELALEYLPVLRLQLMTALSKGESGFEEVSEILNDYGLNRDDLAVIQELGEAFSSISITMDTKTKTKLTKKLNKETVSKVSRFDKKSKLTKTKTLKAMVGGSEDDASSDEETEKKKTKKKAAPKKRKAPAKKRNTAPKKTKKTSSKKK